MASPSFAATSTTVRKAPKPSAANAAFCTQMASSQSAIASAATSSKIKVTAQEWAKLDKVAPSTIKASTTVLAAAYAASEKAHRNSVIRDTAFNNAANAVSSFATANCAAASTAGQRGNGDDDDDNDGPGDDGDFAAVQACLKAKGVTLPGRGPGGERRRPPNAANTTGSTIKGQTPPPRGDDGEDDDDGPGRGRRPQLDAKTEKALQECFASAGRK